MDAPVFISYSSSDKAVADQICASLEGSGTACWIAPRDIPAGADYPAAILDGLRRSRAVVVIVSAAAVASPHVLTEIGHAFSNKKPIVPFRLTAVPLPADCDYFLSLSQWLDAPDGCTPANLARLRDALSRTGGGAGRAAGPASNKWLLPGAAALLLACAVAAVSYWKWPAATPTLPVAPSADLKTKSSNPPPAETKLQPWVNPKDGLTYVWIPPGTFIMGCSAGDSDCRPDESHTHPVTIASGFWMGQTEVTLAAYQRVLGRIKFQASEAKLPVVNVSRADAKTYCAAAGGRVPTEAEWEYAARGGIAASRYGAAAQIAWHSANSGGTRRPVAILQPNAYGLYDMLGNASEWVLDRYYDKYDIDAPGAGKVEEPLAGNALALTRGGYWDTEPQDLRVSRRTPMENDEPGPMAGIRCVIDKR